MKCLHKIITGLIISETSRSRFFIMSRTSGKQKEVILKILNDKQLWISDQNIFMFATRYSRSVLDEQKKHGSESY